MTVCLMNKEDLRARSILGQILEYVSIRRYRVPKRRMLNGAWTVFFQDTTRMLAKELRQRGVKLLVISCTNLHTSASPFKSKTPYVMSSMQIGLHAAS